MGSNRDEDQTCQVNHHIPYFKLKFERKKKVVFGNSAPRFIASQSDKTEYLWKAISHLKSDSVNLPQFCCVVFLKVSGPFHFGLRDRDPVTDPGSR